MLSISLNWSFNRELPCVSTTLLRLPKLHSCLFYGFIVNKLIFFLSSQVIILIGNKADLEAQRDVTYEEAKQFAEENGESDAEQCMLFFFVDRGNGFLLEWIMLLNPNTALQSCLFQL